MYGKQKPSNSLRSVLKDQNLKFDIEGQFLEKLIIQK